MLTGEGGILAKAKLAKERSEQAEQEENSILKQYEELLDNYGKELPENTTDTEAGTLVKMPSGWYTKTADEIETKDGNVSIPGKTTANVYAVSDGQAKTVPVPYGFYYVGGTVESGVVISDEQKDRNKYKGQEDVPAGVAYNADGTVNKENSELQGNQFVWIPCTIDEYKKINFGTDYSLALGYDIVTYTAEKIQIQKYEGFYVGRYEAGTSEITLANNIKFENTATADTDSNIWGLNRDFISSKVTSGKITSKAGEISYHHADYTTAVEMSERMYHTEYIQSGLMTGTMWDVMMKFIATDKINYSDLKDTPWGNYINNTTVIYETGRGRYLVVKDNGSITSKATVADSDYHYGIRTTASSEGVKKNNLYDVAGNLYEWTQENAYDKELGKVYYSLRGGAFSVNYSERPVCIRGYRESSLSNVDFGFRPVLYIK